MFICIASDIHAAMDRVYDDLLAFEESLNVRFDYVLHVGDFGVRSDPDRIDKAARKHDGTGDLPVNYRLLPANSRASVVRSGNTPDTPVVDWFERRAEGGLAMHGCREGV
jgi:predicted phosphodiesterase